MCDLPMSLGYSNTLFSYVTYDLVLINFNLSLHVQLVAVVSDSLIFKVVSVHVHQ